MPLDTLQQGIRFGMMENLMIQYIYPDYELPAEYVDVIESIDHSKIKPTKEDADILVLNGFAKVDSDVPVVLRINKRELFGNEDKVEALLEKIPRLNVILTDVETFTEEDFEGYRAILEKISDKLDQMYVSGKTPQLNILTDRILLTQMNNCGAGDTSITLAPNGRFYVCPAFYYDEMANYKSAETESVGDLEYGLDIKNKQLYMLDHAPICRHCDAWQCKRCVWLNRKTTLEVNTPSHEQCVLAHLERNASRLLLNKIRGNGSYSPETDIKELSYLDPFEEREKW